MGDVIHADFSRPRRELKGFIPDEPVRIPQHHLDNAAAIPSHLMGNSIEFGPDGTTTVNGGVREFRPYKDDLITFAKKGEPIANHSFNPDDCA